MAITVALLSSTGVQAAWQEASSKHFVVYSDDTPEKVKAFTARLERFDKALKVLRQVPEDNRGPSARVTVYVLPSVSDVQSLYHGSQSIAGFYQSRASGAVAFVPRRSTGDGSFEMSAQRILLHEYSHHFMYADWPSGIYPMWFSEGFAEFNSTAIFNPDGSVTFGAPPLDRGQGVTMVNQMPANRMLRPDPGKMSDMETYALYSRGWLLTHYLTFDPDRRRQLATYITKINAGDSVEDASKVFGNLNTLDFKLTTYVKSRTFQSARIPADALAIGDVTIRQLGAGEAAIMPARMRSTAGVDVKQAPVNAVLARRLAAPYPNDAAAQNELAEAEYDARNYAASEAAAARAMAADPGSIHAALYRGQALQAIAEHAKSTDPAQWQAIRRWYIAANKIDSEDPEPLILFYRSFGAAHQAPTKSASAGMVYAAALAPFDLDIRLDAARVNLQAGKVKEARDQMLPVVYSPHIAAKTGEKLRTALAAIDRNDAPEALTILDATIADAKDKAKKTGE